MSKLGKKGLTLLLAGVIAMTPVSPSLGFSTMTLWKQLNTQYIASQHSCWLFSFFNT